MLMSNFCACLQDGKQSTSWWLKFEALCDYFSQSNGHTLLELPKTISKVTSYSSSLDDGSSYVPLVGQGAEHRHCNEYPHHHDTSGSKRGGHYQR